MPQRRERAETDATAIVPLAALGGGVHFDCLLAQSEGLSDFCGCFQGRMSRKKRKEKVYHRGIQHYWQAELAILRDAVHC